MYANKNAYIIGADGKREAVVEVLNALIELFDEETRGREPTAREYRYMATLFSSLAPRIIGSDAAVRHWRLEIRAAVDTFERLANEAA